MSDHHAAEHHGADHHASEHHASEHHASEHQVVIAGGGPTGMMLSAELALAGAEVVIVEPRPDQHLDGSRAGGLHARTIEVLDQRGVADRFLAAGRVMQVQGFAGIPLDISDFPTRHPYGLALWQADFEPILAEWVAELGVPTLREVEVVGFEDDGEGVTTRLSDGRFLRSAYLVGCDGGRSLVRRTAGIEFVGTEPTRCWLLAEVEFDDAPQLGMRPEGGGIGPVNIGSEGGPYRVVLVEDPAAVDAEAPDLEFVRESLVGLYGSDFGLRSASWVTRFSDQARQAAAYRAGRVLLAGDAAHIHAPTGGQGMNVGIQDAVNLGWKLAQVVRGLSDDSLLDTYHEERHPVAARVLHNTRAQVVLSTPGDHHQALRDIVGDLLALDEPRRRIAGMMSGLDVRYDLGDGHPLIGWRMPDLDLVTGTGRTRVAELLQEARPLLLDLGSAGSADHDALAGSGGSESHGGRVRVVAARAEGSWELPVVGPVPEPEVVLVRPDGHVAWAGDRDDPAIRSALTRWFGAGR